MSEPEWGLAEGDAIAPGRTVVRRLGVGSRYEVFLVWDDHLCALAVAKLLRVHRVEDERALSGIRREAEALARLAHPVVLRGFDAVLDGPRPHVLVEHVEGPTLGQLLRKSGSLEPQQLLPLALNVASALHYLSGERMVHLDVKPANVVMGIPPRLIDLSLARSIDSARRIRSPVGTREYMAPEQCAPGEAGEIGPPADVFGLAATLYHAVAGRPPFAAGKHRAEAGAAERFAQLAGDPAPLPRAVAPALAGVIQHALDRDPAKRPSAMELVLGLEPLVAALPRRLTLGRRGAFSR